MNIESPCINVCKLDENTGLCAGCMRSIEEIRAWREATPEEKLSIREAAENRKLAKAA